MTTLEYSEVGNGSEKVLVIHDWMSDHSTYDSVLPYLNTKDFTYVFADLRGYGKSNQIEGKHTAQESAQDILHLVNTLDWGKFHVIGHSMGGMIAQRIAVDAEDRLKSLIAITPVPASGIPIPESIIHAMQKALETEEGRRQLLQMQFGTRLSDEWLEFKLRRWKETSNPKAVADYLLMFTQTNFSKEVQGLKTPILVIVGEYDHEAFGEAAMKQSIFQWFPHAQLNICRNAGHYPLQETPVYLASVITKFLKECM